MKQPRADPRVQRLRLAHKDGKWRPRVRAEDASACLRDFAALRVRCGDLSDPEFKTEAAKMLRPYQTSLARHRRAAAASPVGRQRPRAAASPVGGTDRQRFYFQYAPSRWKVPVERRVWVLAADFSACTEDFAALRLRGEAMSKKAFLEACAELEAPYIRRREERLRETPRGSAGGVPARLLTGPGSPPCLGGFLPRLGRRSSGPLCCASRLTQRSGRRKHTG